jgi:hypothetical protein
MITLTLAVSVEDVVAMAKFVSAQLAKRLTPEQRIAVDVLERITIQAAIRYEIATPETQALVKASYRAFLRKK